MGDHNSLFYLVLFLILWRLRSIATHMDHFVRRLSVRLSVCPSVTLFCHTFQSYVSQATHAFLGMLPLFFMNFGCLYSGKGLFTTREYAKGEFLTEYEGELISDEEGKRRFNAYRRRLGSFIFFFNYKRKKMWLVLDNHNGQLIDF